MAWHDPISRPLSDGVRSIGGVFGSIGSAVGSFFKSGQGVGGSIHQGWSYLVSGLGSFNPGQWLADRFEDFAKSVFEVAKFIADAIIGFIEFVVELPKLLEIWFAFAWFVVSGDSAWIDRVGPDPDDVARAKRAEQNSGGSDNNSADDDFIFKDTNPSDNPETGQGAGTGAGSNQRVDDNVFDLDADPATESPEDFDPVSADPAMSDPAFKESAAAYSDGPVMSRGILVASEGSLEQTLQDLGYTDGPLTAPERTDTESALGFGGGAKTVLPDGTSVIEWDDGVVQVTSPAQNNIETTYTIRNEEGKVVRDTFQSDVRDPSSLRHIDSRVIGDSSVVPTNSNREARAVEYSQMTAVQDTSGSLPQQPIIRSTIIATGPTNTDSPQIRETQAKGYSPPAGPDIKSSTPRDEGPFWALPKPGELLRDEQPHSEPRSPLHAIKVYSERPFTNTVIRHQDFANPSIGADFPDPLRKGFPASANPTMSPAQFAAGQQLADASPEQRMRVPGRRGEMLLPELLREYVAVSELPEGSSRHPGKRYWIDIARAEMAGAEFISHQDLDLDFRQQVDANKLGAREYSGWKRLQPLEGEAGFRGSVPASAIETAGMRNLKTAGRVFGAFGAALTAVDILKAGVKSVEDSSPRPLATELGKQGVSWGASVLAYSGATVIAGAVTVSAPLAIGIGIAASAVAGAGALYLANDSIDDVYDSIEGGISDLLDDGL